jgi:hypothetical protein
MSVSCDDRDRVINKEDWMLMHADHVRAAGRFRWQKHNHPTEPMVWLICSCGSQYLTISQERYDQAEPYEVAL